MPIDVGEARVMLVPILHRTVARLILIVARVPLLEQTDLAVAFTFPLLIPSGRVFRLVISIIQNLAGITFILEQLNLAQYLM